MSFRDNVLLFGLLVTSMALSLTAAAHNLPVLSYVAGIFSGLAFGLNCWKPKRVSE